MGDRDLLICGGQVIDPANGINGKRDILLRHGRVDVVGENLPPGTNRVIDATGCLVIPGLVDAHVHLSEPFGGAQGIECWSGPELLVRLIWRASLKRSRRRRIGSRAVERA
jgi:predicted amidohydrolase